jgi:proton-coupled amino acid transporter
MLGTGIYAFEGIGTVLPCETSMKEPQKFPLVLFSVMGFSTINYLLFGLIPYLAFGLNTSDQITINLQQFARCQLPNSVCHGNEAWVVLTNIVSVLLILAITGTFPLQLFVVTDITEEWLFRTFASLRSRLTLWTNLWRTLLVALACVIAISIPQFGLLMGLIGSLGGATLQFIFPASFALQLEWQQLSIFRRCLYIFYICFGAIAGIMGFIQTIEQLADLG